MRTTIGTYYPVQSFIHRLDGRVKILLVLLGTVTLFIVKSFYALLFLALFYLLVFLLSNLPAYWIYKALRPVLVIILIAFLFQIGFSAEPDIFLRVIAGLRVVSRIVILVGLASVMSFTTTPPELTFALESLLAPLKILKLPVAEFALSLTIALRFIPQILTEASDLVKAQKARGADFSSSNWYKRGKALIPLFVPLFILTYRQSEELGRAMEARAYHGADGRSRYKERYLKNTDYLVFAATLIILTIALLIGRL